MYTKINRFLISVQIVMRGLHSRISRMLTNVGHWFFDLTLYRGRPGHIEWGDVDTDIADGYITVRAVVEGVHQIETVNFYVTNRWPIRDGRKPSAAFMFAIRSEAIRAGYPIISSFWFTQTAAVQERPLLGSLTERAESFLERHARNWAGRMAVADNSYDLELRQDLERDIILRQKLSRRITVRG